MKFLSSIILTTAFLTFDYTEINYRPYISTRLAKVIMIGSDEVVVEEKCDGSGWITHGDGHKTECPGCSACQDSVKPLSVCQCGCEKAECKCQQASECLIPPSEEQSINKKKRPRFFQKNFNIFRR